MSLSESFMDLSNWAKNLADKHNSPTNIKGLIENNG